MVFLFGGGNGDAGYIQVSAYDTSTAEWSTWTSVGNTIANTSPWSPMGVDLTPYAGEKVRIGFFHTATTSTYPRNCGASSTGWYIDDIEVPHVNLDWNLDVDVNGEYDALTDGLLVLRHLFGFSGITLTDGALATDATRTDPQAITDYLAGCCPDMLDVDANGQCDALTDGLLVLRYLFGFSGPTLTDGALATDATRTDPADIGSFLDQFAQ